MGITICIIASITGTTSVIKMLRDRREQRERSDARQLRNVHENLGWLQQQSRYLDAQRRMTS